RLVGRAPLDGRELTRTLEPDRGRRLVTAMLPADLAVETGAPEVAIQPGSQATVTVRVERRNGFAGRVPIEVRNLPDGVRVLDVGLNGVLITEQETSRRFTLYAEPWAKPQTRPPYPVATVETDPASQVAAAPVALRVLPGGRANR